MSRRRPPWSTLGIDRTTDERAIKRAYSVKLKAIDVEAEPAKFIALRTQFERALNLARCDGGSQKEESAIEAGLSSAFDAATLDHAAVSAAVDHSDQPARPWTPAKTDNVDRRFAAIEALLNAGGADEPAIDREMRALWAEPALETVDAADNAEQRLAYMALDYGRAASYLLRLASWHYGWARRANIVGADWPVSEAGRRAAAENWMARIASGDEPALRPSILTEIEQPPSGRWWRDYFRKRRIAEFLAILRQRTPEGEYRFDAEVVAAWETVRTPHISPDMLMLAGAAGVAVAAKTGFASNVWRMPGFWLLWLASIIAIATIRFLLRNRAAVDRRDQPLDRIEAIAFVTVLGCFALSMAIPPNEGFTAVLIVGAFMAMLATHAAIDPDHRRNIGYSLFAARYLLIAAIMFLFHLTRDPSEWRFAVVPGCFAMASAHLLRDRLVRSWEALPRLQLVAVRGVLLGMTALLLLLACRALPNAPEAPWVATGIILLLVQDAAANAWRPALRFPIYFFYLLAIAGLIRLPLILAMLAVGRRLIDRLFLGPRV